MKKILSVLLSFCVLHTQMTYIGCAYAGDETPSVNSTVAINEDGSATLTVDSQAENAQGYEDSSLYVNTIVMLVVGFLGPLMLLACYNQADVWLAAITAVAHIASEISRFSDYSDELEQINEEYEGSKIVVEVADATDTTEIMDQKASVKAALDLHQAATDTTKERAIWMSVAAAGYTIAAIVSLVFAILEETIEYDTSCQSFSISANEPFKNDNFFNDKLDKLYLAYLDQAAGSTERYYLFEEWRKTKLGEENACLSLNYYQQSLPIVESGINSLENSEVKRFYHWAISSMSNILLPQVLAASDDPTPTATEESGMSSGETSELVGMVVGVGAAVILAVVLLMSESMMEWLSSLLDEIWIRFAVFTVFAALGYVVMGLSWAAHGQLEQRTAEFQKLYDQLNFMENAQTISAPKAQAKTSISTITAPVDTTVVTHTPPKKCTAPSGKGGLIPQASECKGQTYQFKTVDFSDIPAGSLVSSSAQDISTAGNLVASGSDNEALTLANKVGNKLAALQKKREEMEEKANKTLKSKGEKPRDFKKDVSVAKTKFMKRFDQAYARLTPAQQNQLENFVKNGYVAPVNSQQKETLEKLLANKKVLKDSKKRKSLADFLKDDDHKNTANKTVEEVAANNKLYHYDERNAVNKEKEKDLFKIITNRYLQTAMPIFYDRIPLAPQK